MALSRRASILIGVLWMFAALTVVLTTLVLMFGLSWLLSLASWLG